MWETCVWTVLRDMYRRAATSGTGPAVIDQVRDLDLGRGEYFPAGDGELITLTRQPGPLCGYGAYTHG
jgi:hypothetical protein